MSDAGEKKYEPSAEKVRKSREKGNYAKFPLFFALVPIIVAGFLSVTLVPYLFRFCWRVFQEAAWARGDVRQFVHLLLWVGVGATVLVLLCAAGVGVLLQWLVLRPGVVTSSLTPDLSKLAPWKGFVRIKQEFVEQLQLVGIRIGIGVYFMHGCCYSALLLSSSVSPGGVLRAEVIGGRVRSLIFSALLCCSLVAAAEAWLKWRRRFKELRMSEQEMRDEYKELEGDPHLKAERSAEHRRMSLEEIERRVKNSKVLVVGDPSNE